jgi:hypothetical protein
VAVWQGDLVAGQAREGDVDLVVGLRARADDRVAGHREVADRGALAPAGGPQRRAVVAVPVVVVRIVIGADLDGVPALVDGHRAIVADSATRF